MGVLKGGHTHLGSANEQLMLHPTRAFLNDVQIAQLCERSLRVVGDLMCVVDGERGWIDGVDLGLPWRRKHMFILHDVPWGKPNYRRQFGNLGLPWLNGFTDKLSIPTDAVASRNG